jgi:hypothetical protein
MAGSGSGRGGSTRGSGAGSGGLKTGSVGAGARMVEIRRNVNNRITRAFLDPSPKIDRRTKAGKQAIAERAAARKRMLDGAGAVIKKNNPQPDRRGSGNRSGRRLLERRAGATGLRFGSRINQRRNESGLGGPASVRQIRGRRAGTIAR